MNFLLNVNIAVALLKSRKKQTIIAAVGVMFSITMFITLLGFMNGLNAMLDSLILNRTPHIRLYNELKPAGKQPIEISLNSNHTMHVIQSVKPSSKSLNIRNYQSVLSSVLADERVLGTSPKLSVQVIYNVGPTDMAGVVNGVDLQKEMDLFFFKDYVPEGNPIWAEQIPNSIILGKVAAEKMMAKVGDMITVSGPTGEQLSMKVVGFFQSGIQDFDKVQSYTSLETAQKLMGKNSQYITDLQIKLKDLQAAPQMAKEYAMKYDVDAIDLQTANSQFETGTKIRSIISYAVGITLLIVAGFGIYNILNMMIYEKMDTIAILKATGFSGPDVRMIFLFIAMFIGLSGALLGLVFGFALSSLVDLVPFNVPALPTVTSLPVDYNPKFYIIGAIFGTITSYFAGYFPSRKASQIDPVQIIRGK